MKESSQVIQTKASKEVEEKGICIVDNCGKIIYVNNLYANLLEANAERLLGENIKEIFLNCTSKALVKNAEVNNTDENIKYQYFNISKVNKNPFIKFIGESKLVKNALNIGLKAARGLSTVLIYGESGTGKELIAEGIHRGSERAGGEFIKVNCAAIPSTLLESELFGHERGAFTGAVRRKLGKFELAQGGSIFLDEIGDLEKSMQVKLLRVLQEREFQRIGGEETLKTDARIIVATNRNLEEMVAKGEFREDLYYRLNVIPINLPPLRDRKEDIPLLVNYFLKKMNLKMHKNITKINEDVMKVFMSYKWPGNVRELENIMERISTLVEGNYISVSDIPHYMLQTEGYSTAVPEKSLEDDTLLEILKLNSKDTIFPLKVYEKKIIKTALEKYGSYNAAGKALGLSHKTVASKARQYGIEKNISWGKNRL
ncbi:transcriptional regulator with PAS, ATPase and Fis domain [Clostridium tetanomorphum]|uniref:sigma-54 interaction domain-containing protein n=1 Tax=Clostridium tetanomorphum TaxID=1553 RepID=UPI0004463B9C|nr:sigma 54-interacting transcriptional regulator [Clostridium tetanomorphum]KAJ53450.1 sigma-54 dependent transcription regulator [Clostridium tetanomorphum DSM 665]MBP1865321.1 transcriptional regulator with PAS, ATPase and Fis domain [Clostridium tetanomorphum]NRS85244.1 transcriptional regulator with PAS, ATPase and Fis domain [Clostridium tetanomorphum]NRZ98421.1 transcriptional regulator with PAS, ATPase and Fis domain [Clostridium tetanomorphum]SQC03047.1 sigma-54 dependent trancsriptio